MAKLPWIKFFTNAWLTDPALTMCSDSTRGIWMDLLCAMHNTDQKGTITGTPEQLAKVCRTTTKNMIKAIEELKQCNAANVTCNANVTQSNSIVTVCNRRMQREAKATSDVRLRVAKYREKRKCNTPVTVEKIEDKKLEDREKKKEQKETPKIFPSEKLPALRVDEKLFFQNEFELKNFLLTDFKIFENSGRFYGVTDRENFEKAVEMFCELEWPEAQKKKKSECGKYFINWLRYKKENFKTKSKNDHSSDNRTKQTASAQATTITLDAVRRKRDQLAAKIRAEDAIRDGQG